jgi:carbon-monoxide dehydrogenase large subunit
MTNYVGQSQSRVEDPALIRGLGHFIDDLELPGLLEVAVLRSPVAHGLIRGFDATEARRYPGVRAVLALADLRPVLAGDRLPLQFKSDTLPPNISPFVLTEREVCYVGEAIALVVADSRYVAEDAVALIKLDIEELPVASDCRDAYAPDAPLTHIDKKNNVLTTFAQSYGDAAAAVKTAPHHLELSLKQHRGGAHPIECRGVVAHYQPFDDTLTVWTSTQAAHEVRAFVVRMLGLDENRVRIVTPDVGGGFGAKFVLYPEEVAIAAASRLLGAPIKWIEDRREHFVASIQERDQYWDLEIGFDGSGKLLAAKGRMIHDAGAYTLQGVNLPYNASTAFLGPYVLPAYHLDVVVVETNKVPTIPVRGAGYPEGTFAMERSLDAIADYLQLDRIEVRRRNLVPPTAMPYTTPLKARWGSAIVYDSGDFVACLDRVASLADHTGFEERRRRAAQDGRYLGFGVAAGLKGTGRGPFESATVRIGRSGKVSVYTGAMAMGQGLKTVLAQICASQLGVNPSDITVICGDTATISLGLGGFASRQTVTAGNSVHVAAKQVREKVRKVAEALLEAAAEDIELSNGRAVVIGTDYGVSLAQVAEAVAGVPGYSIPGNIPPGLEASENLATGALTYGLGVHAVEVEVDIQTGEVKLKRYAIITDCGRAVNPMLVEGQIHGGVVHGIGNTLFEWMGYDDRAQPITMTLGEYLLPTAPEIPFLDVEIVEYPSPLNPLGVKGVGEAGTVPAAPAIISAIEDALKDWGVTISEIPLSPAKLFSLIRGAEATGRRNSFHSTGTA